MVNINRRSDDATDISSSSSWDGVIITSGGYDPELEKRHQEYEDEEMWGELDDINDQARKKARIIQNKKSVNSRNRFKSFKPNVRSSNTCRR